MKSIEQLCRRVVIIQVFADRCAVEDENAGGQFRTLKEREDQRIRVLDWLNGNSYGEFITAYESKIFELPVGTNMAKDILAKEIICETIEPLLWCMGLVKNLTPFNKFVLVDYHSKLEMGKDHSFEKLVLKSKMKDKSDIIRERDIAMLWQWRAIEGSTKLENVQHALLSIFEEPTIELALKNIDISKKGKGDFKVGGKEFSKLSSQEIIKIRLISYWRQFAYEWVLNDVEWDDIEMNT